MKFLTLYNRWMKTGMIPGPGLCNSVPFKMTEVLDDMEPMYKDYTEISRERLSKGYWGSGLALGDGGIRVQREFTPLRQTIILLCAALNGEFDEPVKPKK
jgi:hypothetical protein